MWVTIVEQKLLVSPKGKMKHIPGVTKVGNLLPLVAKQQLRRLYLYLKISNTSFWVGALSKVELFCLVELY